MADDPFVITQDGDRPVPRHEEELERRRFRLTNWWKWGVALLSLALFSGLLWYAYQSGMQDDGGPIRTVEADEKPFKVKPEEPGGINIPDQDKMVFSEAVGRPDEGPETLAPSSEAPMSRPEPIISEVSQPEPAKPPKPPKAPKPKAPKPKAPKPAAVEKSAPAVLSKPAGAEEKPAPVASAPSVPPANAPLSKPPGAGVSGTSLAAQSKINVPKALDPRATGVLVQLGSFSDMDAAKQAWGEIRPRYPDILVSPNAQVKQAMVGGKSYHRLMVGPYATRDDADAVCNLLKSRGRDCFIVLP